MRESNSHTMRKPAVPGFSTSPVEQHSVFSDDPGDWAHIYHPEISLVAYERSPDPALLEFSREAARLNINLSLRLTDSRQLSTHWEQSSLTALAGYQDWQADVATWIEAFQCLFEPRMVGLRLRTLGSAMCPRFHVDQVPVRLVATYGARTTEWLANADADRSQLGIRGRDCSDLEAGLYRDDNSVRQLPPFSVALLKGEAWSGNEGRGLVHRSPALRPFERRLLLTLDMLC